MAFTLEHWRNPRRTIATRFEKNDMSYATHGAIMALEALAAIDLPISITKEMTILDYGCGTGRISRILSKAFKHVYAYDPVRECIDLARTECIGLDFPNITYYTNINDIPETDIAVSINVIEHLDEKSSNQMLLNLKNKVLGFSYIWYSSRRNTNLLAKYLPEETKKQNKILEDLNGGDKILVHAFNFREVEI